MARKNGHLVFLCSGRNYDMLKPLLKYGFDGFVANSGGYIRCGSDLIYDCPMTDSQKEMVMKTIHENGIYMTVECLDGSYTDETFKRFLQLKAENGGNSEVLRWREQIEKSLNIRPMSEYTDQPVYKIVIMSPYEDNLIRPVELLGHDFKFCIQDGKNQDFINGEIVNCKFDKGQSLKRVCSYLGFSTQDSIAFGDSSNDKEMLEAAGLSICMENGNGLC